MSLSTTFGKQSTLSSLGFEFGLAQNYISDSVSVGPSGSARDAGAAPSAVSNSMDFGAPQI